MTEYLSTLPSSLLSGRDSVMSSLASISCYATCWWIKSSVLSDTLRWLARCVCVCVCVCAMLSLFLWVTSVLIPSSHQVTHLNTSGVKGQRSAFPWPLTSDLWPLSTTCSCFLSKQREPIRAVCCFPHRHMETTSLHLRLVQLLTGWRTCGAVYFKPMSPTRWAGRTLGLGHLYTVSRSLTQEYTSVSNTVIKAGLGPVGPSDVDPADRFCPLYIPTCLCCRHFETGRQRLKAEHNDAAWPGPNTSSQQLWTLPVTPPHSQHSGSVFKRGEEVKRSRWGGQGGVNEEEEEEEEGEDCFSCTSLGLCSLPSMPCFTWRDAIANRKAAGKHQA